MSYGASIAWADEEGQVLVCLVIILLSSDSELGWSLDRKLGREAFCWGARGAKLHYKSRSFTDVLALQPICLPSWLWFWIWRQSSRW